MRTMACPFVALVMTCGADAQGPQPPYGTTWGYARQFKYGVRVEGFSEANIRVSGTKVDFKVAAGLEPRMPEEPYNDPPQWQHMKLLELKCYIGNTLVETFVPEAGFSYGMFKKTIRFASTHFDDDSAVTLKAVAKFKFWNVDPPSEEIVNGVEALAVVKTHNKAQVVATQKDVDPKTGTFIDGRNLGLYADTSKSSATAAIPAIQSMKHTVFVTQGLDDQPKSSLLSRYPNQTLLFNFTHGGTTWFTDSYEGKIYFSNPDDVTPALGNSRTDEHGPGLVPHHNIVIMYACSTLGAQGNGSWAAPIAFGVVSAPWVTKPNRAYVGFTGLIWYGENERTSLVKHSAKLLEELGKGRTIEQAVYEANRTSHVRTAGLNSIAMILRGDKHSRLIDAYTGSRVNKSWFYVLE